MGRSHFGSSLLIDPASSHFKIITMFIATLRLPRVFRTVPNVGLLARGSSLPLVRCRGFSSKPKVEDHTLEGRYATALFMASHKKLDKVQTDLQAINKLLATSPDFKLMVESPGIQPEERSDALIEMSKRLGTDEAVVNFLKVLVENKRLHLLERMIGVFEEFYRAEKNLVLCQVTSATELTEGRRADVAGALQSRVGKDSKLLIDYDVNPAILGGLVVKMGNAVLDNSVASRVEQLQKQLLMPVS